MLDISSVIKTIFLNEITGIDTKDPIHKKTDTECLKELLDEREKLEKNKDFPNRMGYRTYEEVLERLVVLDRVIAELVGKNENELIVEMTGTNG